MKDIDIIGVQLDLGASKKGVNIGPLSVRFAGVCERLAENGFSYEDKGDLVAVRGGASLPNMKHYEAIFDICGKLHRSVHQSLAAGRFPLIIGGDHSLAAGSASAVCDHYGKIGIVWIDAHADFNDDKSTVTGNVHGMPLSALCGAGPDSMVSYAVKMIDPANAVIIGARDVEPQEWVRLRELGVTVFTMKDIKELGIEEVTRRAAEIARKGTEGLHLSFDMDAIDPSDAPGVGTPVPGGISAGDALKAVRLLSKEKLLGMDLVETNPILDQGNRTSELAVEIIAAALGKADR